MVAVAVDQSAILHREQAQRESQERYRDLFENSSEMIATLSPAGQFLYANPAWKRCFGLDSAALMDLHSFEDLFAADTRSEAAALFRRALDGEAVERAPLRHHTPDGRVLDLELSLSRRQKAGIPLAVRCLLRDVTQQKQRENRLALQLAVSQIVGENAPGAISGHAHPRGAVPLAGMGCGHRMGGGRRAKASRVRNRVGSSRPARGSPHPGKHGLDADGCKRTARTRLAGWAHGLDHRPGSGARKPPQ